ncbi:GH92 family glycosyl hydrolase [Sabulilitoribacter arenilitoris]|uniref:GH92 family glycosyl hydrolase n=1 Tax=Wocania arenilitoris TaxID=2044858 RepID=A0AAE3EPT5_9FLAO|nr:GH92 family glycosyl hydrolase [Wocania arenilitoris]MCF7567840.1 GH92 family glycosyl hydrolase [Wocania arenilitoris]
MLKKGILLIVSIILFFNCIQQKDKPITKLTDFVNPFIGTDGPGNTYPGSTVPFGMVQLSPDIGIPGWDRIAGYYYQDSIISGFSHMHLTGTGAGDLYDILVMPTNSRFNKRIKENSFKPFSSFSHDKEAASPGYYTVDLLDYGIKAEVTATQRTGIHKYTFPKDSLSQIHIDLGYTLNWDAPTDTHIKVVNNTTIEGYRKSVGWAKDQRVYFQMQFSKPFDSYQLYQSDTLINRPKSSLQSIGDKKKLINSTESSEYLNLDYRDSAKAKNTKIILNYNTDEDEEIVLKTGLSTANIDGAKLSLKKEASHFNFETYKTQADSIWEEQLQKIHIETKDKTKKHIFYTMLYQSMLAPTLLSDYNNNYKGANDTVMKADGYNRYDTFSLWDTYRAAHPLYTIMHPERVSDMMQSLLAHYKETGLLPVWSMQGNETNMMIGYHAIPVIVDAYFKGIDFDAQLAFEACKASAMDDNRQIDVYKKLGFIPVDEAHENWSVSKTLEYAFGDWCVAQFAKALNKTDDYEYFLKRSKNWKNMYDEKSSFMRPKLEDGTFVKDFIPKDYSAYFCESNAWQYFWSVQHDVNGLIKTVGGNERFEQKLDSMFTLYPLPTDKLPIFSTGMIGQYAHGNEPSHHVGYLYNYIDKPWKTQKIIRDILNTQYKNEPNGHCGNEDCGQMSSWYIFSSLGFYPVNPAEGLYQFGSPIFDETTINLENGNQFKIETINNSKSSKYIESITLNGETINRNYITHKEIINGGTLVFKMSDSPRK